MVAYYILLAACVPLVIVPPLFIYNHIYQDGLIGRAGLIGISASSAFLWLFHLTAEDGAGVPLPLIAGLVASFAIFLIWHLFRFHSRVVLERRGRVEARICGKTVEAP